jgi:hypothetical protein
MNKKLLVGTPCDSQDLPHLKRIKTVIEREREREN